MLGGRVTWVRVAPRRSVLIADGRVVGVIDGLALAAPRSGADHVLVRPLLGAVELVGEVPTGVAIDDLRRAVEPVVELERDLLAWILVAPDARQLPHRAIVLSTTADPDLEHATARFSRASLPGDGSHRPPRSIEGLQDSAVKSTRVDDIATIVKTLADHAHRYVAIEIQRDPVAALTAIEDAIVEGDLLVVLMRQADGTYLVRMRVDGRRAGYDLAPPVTWARIWSTVSYRLVRLSMQQTPLLDELGDPLYIDAGFVDLLDRPEVDARRLLLDYIDLRLHGMKQNAHYAERLLRPFELACERAGDAVHRALCHGLRGRHAKLNHDTARAIAFHRTCVAAVASVSAEDDPATTRALVGLGQALHDTGSVEAIDVLADAVARMRRRGDDTVDLGVALETLGRAQRKHGKYADAVTTLRDGFRVQKAFGARWPENCLHEAELALEADGRFSEALAMVDELRILTAPSDEHGLQRRILDESEARCRIALGELEAAASLLVALRRETYSAVDRQRVDALIDSLPPEVREARLRSAADAERTVRDQVAAAEAPLREEARSRGMVLLGMHMSTGAVYLHLAPRDEMDGPARPSYRARCAELVALAAARIVAIPVEVQLSHLDHRAGRIFEARARIERSVRELAAGGLEGYAADDPFGRVDLIDVRAGWTQIDLVLGTHGPAAITDARDLAFEIIARVREAHPEHADVPMGSRVQPVFVGTGTYPYDGAHLAPETVALLEALRRFPRRAEIDISALQSASELSDDVRAVVHTVALHAVEGETVGDALYFDKDAIASCGRSQAPAFVLAYDMRDPSRTLVVERDNRRTRSVRWWPGIWSPDSVHHTADDSGTLGMALAGIVDENAVRASRAALAASFERATSRSEARARRFGERGWIGWIVHPTTEQGGDDDGNEYASRHERSDAADGWQIDITSGADRDHVFRVAPDGTRTEVVLPSAAPYRALGSPTPDRTRWLIASRTRLREVHVASGATRIVMEGPWIVSVAALTDDLVVFASFGGEHTLDRTDPDVAALSSMRQMPPGDSIRLAAAHGIGLCRIGDEPGLVRWIDVDERDMLRLETVLDGRVLVISSWRRALVVAVKEGALIPLRSIDHAWGPSVELFGLEAAWQAARPYQVATLSLHREHDVPAPRRFLVECSDQRMYLERVDIAPVERTIPGAARRALALTEADLLWDRSSCQDFVLLRGGQLRLIRVEGDRAEMRVDERAVEPPIVGEHAAFSIARDGRMVFAGPSGAWWIDRDRATASLIAPQSLPVASIAALSAERVLVLSRHGPVDVRMTLLVDGSVLATWPVHVFDRVCALPGAGLVVLSFQYMPEDQAMTVLLHVSSRGTLHHVSHARISVRDAFERDGRVFIESSDGVFALNHLEDFGALDGSPALAGVYYAPPAALGAAPGVRTVDRAR